MPMLSLKRYLKYTYFHIIFPFFIYSVYLYIWCIVLIITIINYSNFFFYLFFYFKYNVPLLINDNIEVALAIDAEGVHIGQDDMSCIEARKLLGPNKIL